MTTGACAIQCCLSAAFASAARLFLSVTTTNLQSWTFPDEGASCAARIMFPIFSHSTARSLNFLCDLLFSMVSNVSICF